MKNKDILNSILQSEMSEDLEHKLYYSTYLKKKQKLEWDLVAEDSIEFNSDACLEKIERRLNIKKSNSFRMQYYWIAASFILGIITTSILGSFLLKEAKVEPYFVWTSGQQHITPLTLPDGSNVLLGPNSKIVYPQHFNSDERRVKLSGQGYFEVISNKEHPFIVETAQMTITALGTAFEVFSYDENGINEATLASGKIKVSFPNLLNLQKELSLFPNQKIRLLENQICIDSINALQYLSWTQKRSLSFINEKLANIIPRIEKWYGKKIVCDPSLMDNLSFTFSIDTESFSDFCKYLDQVSQLKIIRDGEVFKITRDINQ